MNNLELYCGFHSDKYEMKTCPYCHNSYKKYAGTVSYKINKLEFCSYNCREKYRKENLKNVERVEEKKVKSHRKLSKEERAKLELKYKKQKEDKEIILSLTENDFERYSLTKREKEIVLKLQDGQTMSSIARDYSISPERIRQIRLMILDKIKGAYDEKR